MTDVQDVRVPGDPRDGEEQTATTRPPSDAMPWDQLQQSLVAEFGRMLSTLRRHGVWRDRLAGVGAIRSLDDLDHVPLTTKELLRAAQEDTDADRPLGAFQLAPTRMLRQITSSSGTTGTPVHFGLTEHDVDRWRRATGNAFRVAGVTDGAIVAHTTGRSIVAGGLPYADGIRAAGGALAWIGSQTLPHMALSLGRLRPDILVSTPSFAAHLAERTSEVLGRPAADLGVRTVIAGGETGAGVEHLRRGLMAAWGATRVSEVMGLGDVLPALWAECAAGQGMHFTAAPDVLVELIDPDSLVHVPWEEGATGEAVYTTLGREASPVVRFRSRDQLRVVSVACPCGRTSPTVRCVGRFEDRILSGTERVFPSVIRDVVLDAAADHLTGVMRIRRESAEHARFEAAIPLEVELRADAHPDAAARAIEEAESRVFRDLGVRVRVEPFPPGVLPVTDYKNALTYTPDRA